MKDLGAFETDMAVRGLEKRLTEIYSEASRDITRKMVDFQKKFEAKNVIHLKELKEGKITKDDYNAWLRGQVFQGNQWKAKKEQIEDTLYHANEQATKIINGQMANVFATNANWMSYTMEHDAGVNFGFGLYDSVTVANLVKNNPQILPEWKINEKKDYIWNSKKVNTQITQGILQGESLAKIADRLSENLVSQNKDKMLTFARTSMTCAQNAGRQESLNEAKEKGIDVEKEWMATLDNHTRDAHRDLDGQHVPLDEPFVVDGYEIMYPGDPNAEPFLVYNCRCTMVGNVGKYPAEYDRYDNINGEPIENMTYREWEEAKSESLELGIKEDVPESQAITLNEITRPERPSRQDFDNDDEYYKARHEYVEKREQYNREKEQFIKENSNISSMTVEHMQKWCNDNKITVYGSIDGVDGRAFTAYTERMNQLVKDFPQVLEYRGKLIDGLQYEVAYNDSPSCDYVADAVHGFTFGARFSDFESVLDIQVDDVTSGFRVTGDGTINQLFDHEFGHNLYNMIQWEDGTDRVSLAQDVINSLNGKVGQSEYSFVNDHELFAEAFSAWYGGEDTEFAHAMGDMLKRWGVI